MTTRSLLLAALLLAGCRGEQHPPLALASDVDLARFMGDWYVIANIPTLIEKGAHNAVESYAMNADGTIATTFTFRKDGFDGDCRRLTRPCPYDCVARTGLRARRVDCSVRPGSDPYVHRALSSRAPRECEWKRGTGDRPIPRSRPWRARGGI